VGTAVSGQGDKVQKEDNSEAICVAIDHEIDWHAFFLAISGWMLCVSWQLGLHTLA
jgi:hypothetical protein